jgi:dsDNA-binding SOS-regulon protein
MSRAGVQFTKVQKDMVKELWEAGRAAEAQNIILKELESQFGGAAEAARDTFGGAAQAATNAFGDLLENIGFLITKNQTFIDLLKDTEERFVAIGDAVANNSGKITKFIEDTTSALKISLDIITFDPKIFQDLANAIKKARQDVNEKWNPIDQEAFERHKADLKRGLEARLFVDTTEFDAIMKEFETMADEYPELLIGAEQQVYEERRRLLGLYQTEHTEAKLGETAFAKMQLDEQVADMAELGFTNIEIQETVAERYKELEQEKALASEDFIAGVSVRLEQLAENAQTIAEIGAETTAMLFNSVTKGIGQSVASSILDGQSMAKSMKAVMKNAASSMIANLVKIGVQRLILKSINVGATVAEHKANSAVSVADTFSNAYAATAKIPIVGPILAPIVAAAAAAAALAGISSWGSKGAEGAVSVAHGGLSSVPSEQTFLLDKGERVLSPSQNEDFTEFLANGGNAPNVTFNITAFDSETMTDTVRNTIIPMLQDALTLNSENFRDSVQLAVA